MMTILYICIALLLSSMTDIMGNEYDSISFDGTYNFTSLGEKFQINVCGDQYHSNEIFMSMNAINQFNLKFANYIFGVFRGDLNLIKKKKQTFKIELDGFQMQLPGGDGFDSLTYNLYFNKKSDEYTLTRGSNDEEAFKLNKISNEALNNCFKPGGNLQDDINYPVFLKSVDLDGSGLCQRKGFDSCFERDFIDGAGLEDSCFVLEAQNETRFGGGPLRSVSLEWNGELSLGNFDDITSEVSGSQFTIIDPQSTADSNVVTTSIRFNQGNLGWVYSVTQIDNPLQETCPLI